MPIIARYTPPAVHAGLALHALIPAAEDAMAAVILAKSQELVPVDRGQLKESGHTGRDGMGATVVYDALSPEGYPYGIRVHEDMAAHHPNGGQAKYLETPLHSAREEIMAAAHAVIAAVL